MMTNVVRSPEAMVRIWMARSIFALTMLLASPVAAVAQMPVVRTSIAPIPATRLLVNGVVGHTSDRAHPSAIATPSRRARVIIAGGFLGAIAGGYVGYQQQKNRMCVDSPSFSCPRLEHNTLKVGALGAVLGGITGLLISRL